MELKNRTRQCPTQLSFFFIGGAHITQGRTRSCTTRVRAVIDTISRDMVSRATTAAPALVLVLALASCAAVLGKTSRAVGVDERGSSDEKHPTASSHVVDPVANYSLRLARRHLTQALRGGGLVDVDGMGAGLGGGGDARRDQLERPGSAIPKIIHLLWKTSTFPRFSEAYTRSWLEHHRGWRVIRWTDDTMLAFVREHFPRDEPMWHSFPTGVFRADTFRYMVLRVVGGVYVDLDMEALRPVDPLLEGHTCLLGQEPAAHALLLVDKPRHMCNAWMASAVGEPFWWGKTAGKRRAEWGGGRERGPLLETTLL